MASLRFPIDFKWTTDQFPLCQIGIRLADLARQHSLPIQQWEEDGLGTAEGLICQTESGFTFLIQELRHSIEHLGAKGPAIYVDAEELGLRGIEHLLNQVLSALDLSRSDLTWIQDKKHEEAAAGHGRRAREFILNRGLTMPSSESSETLDR